MNNSNDIGKSLERLKKEMFFVYRGLTFERTKAGFVHNGVLCRDHSEMDILVEQERHNLRNSLKK